MNALKYYIYNPSQLPSLHLIVLVELHSFTFITLLFLLFFYFYSSNVDSLRIFHLYPLYTHFLVWSTCMHL
jgi:hypothetical protein